MSAKAKLTPSESYILEAYRHVDEDTQDKIREYIGDQVRVHRYLAEIEQRQVERPTRNVQRPHTGYAIAERGVS